MPVYPEEIVLLIRLPRSTRPLADPNAIGKVAKLDCGCFIRVEMTISEDGQIEDTAFRSNGCGFMVAAAEHLARSMCKRLLTELSGIQEIPLLMPEDRQGCANAVSDAFRNAFSAYRRKRLDEFRGEKALICTCFGVADESVEEFVATNHPRSVDEVSNSLRAGSGCGSCRMLIQEIIDASERSRVL